jgi:hypothetical protein
VVRQTSFAFPERRGGRRKGAGRKREAARRSVQHRARPALNGRDPVHVTLRLAGGLLSLREARAHARVRNALAAGAERFGLRVIHYSAQSNHIHLVCEAEDERALARGIKGLCVRLARAVNRAWKRKGRFFDGRYHARALATPTEVRNVLVYVLTNAAHHGILLPRGIDPMSSACWFDGWGRRDSTHEVHMRNCPFPRAKTWLMTLGWKLLGLLDPIEAIAARR